MNYQKLTIFIFIFIIFTNGCSTKQKIESKKVEIPISPDEYKLNKLMTKTMKNCNTQKTEDANSSIFIKNYKKYISINLNDKNDFRKGSYVLTQVAKEKFTCIASGIKEEKGLFIVISGHANDNSDNQENQHLSDDRAISLAELFFNVGIRDEIFAKGCSDKNSSIERKLNIYIYADKSKIINHCK